MISDSIVFFKCNFGTGISYVFVVLNNCRVLFILFLCFGCEQVGENDTKARGYSVLSNKNSSTINQRNLKRDLFLGKRYESTATESAASSPPPAEKFEYQAEVWSSFICVVCYL